MPRESAAEAQESPLANGQPRLAVVDASAIEDGKTAGDDLSRRVDETLARLRARHGQEAATLPFPHELDPRDPATIARQFLAHHYTRDATRVLRYWCGDFYAYTGTHYARVGDDEIKSRLYPYLERSKRQGSSGLEPFKPNASIVSNVLDATRGIAFLPASEAPFWLDGYQNDPAAAELVACANGLIHLPTRELLPHNANLFTTFALPFNYRLDAGDPVEWLTFLRSLWSDDDTSIACLQEVFGYVLSGRIDLQKLFLLVGPKRAGKDTIARVLRALLGMDHCAGPTLSSLAGPFGMQQLIDKRLAVIGDARLSGRPDQTVIVERLLSVTGESLQTVDRKHRDPWTGYIRARFLILTNELPRLEEASGALASRFVLLRLTQSFYGREDHGLALRLESELPSIFSWALDGLERLNRTQRFTAPATSTDALDELTDLSSPVTAFVRECCVVDADAWVECGELYDRWSRWCERFGRKFSTAPNAFSRDLHAAFPQIATRQRRLGTERERGHQGLRLRRTSDVD